MGWNKGTLKDPNGSGLFQEEKRRHDGQPQGLRLIRRDLISAYPFWSNGCLL